MVCAFEGFDTTTEIGVFFAGLSTPEEAQPLSDSVP
jgi:hypothetical protein